MTTKARPDLHWPGLPHVRLGIMSGETEESVSGWTTDTLHAHMQTQLTDMRRLLDERYATQTKAVDAAFSAAEIARQTARLEDQRNVLTALASQEKAVTKAETAAETRFSSMNEFRQQLADQASTFISRVEADARSAEKDAKIRALSDRVSTDALRVTERLNEIEHRLTSRLDLLAGQAAGSADSANARRAQVAQMTAILGAVLFAVGIAVTIILSFNT